MDWTGGAHTQIYEENGMENEKNKISQKIEVRIVVGRTPIFHAQSSANIWYYEIVARVHRYAHTFMILMPSMTANANKNSVRCSHKADTTATICDGRWCDMFWTSLFVHISHSFCFVFFLSIRFAGFSWFGMGGMRLSSSRKYIIHSARKL